MVCIKWTYKLPAYLSLPFQASYTTGCYVYLGINSFFLKGNSPSPQYNISLKPSLWHGGITVSLLVDTTEPRGTGAAKALGPSLALPWTKSSFRGLVPPLMAPRAIHSLGLLPRNSLRSRGRQWHRMQPRDFRGPALKVLGRRMELLFPEWLQLPKANNS